MPIQNLSGLSTATTSTQLQSPPPVNRDEAATNSTTTKGDNAEAKPVANQNPQPSSQEQEKQDAEKAAKAIQQFVTPLNNALQFSVDQDSGRTVVKVIDSATHSVIKQFPSEEAIALSKALDKITGLLVEQKV